ncbi:hypothetical protein [Armatimonas sp.]|uniref:hypothetical protein n=1 Tax=Armatimonas sp. TaxID=1872638 RepID=UPI00375332B3
MKAQQTRSFTVTETIPVAGEGFVRLLARAPGCDWSRRGAESAVADITVDGVPRNYLYLDFKTTLAPGSLLAVQATLRDGRTAVSDHNNPTLTVFRSGWNRTAIPLPPGTTPAQLASVRFLRRDKTPAKHAIESVTTFVLDAKYQPIPINLRLL